MTWHDACIGHRYYLRAYDRQLPYIFIFTQPFTIQGRAG